MTDERPSSDVTRGGFDAHVHIYASAADGSPLLFWTHGDDIAEASRRMLLADRALPHLATGLARATATEVVVIVECTEQQNTLI